MTNLTLLFYSGWQVDASVLICLETCFGIIVASLPAIRSLFSCGLISRRPTRGYTYDSNGRITQPSTQSSQPSRHRITATLAGIDAPSQIDREAEDTVGGNARLKRLGSHSDMEEGYGNKEADFDLPVMGATTNGHR